MVPAVDVLEREESHQNSADAALRTLWQLSEQDKFRDLLPHPVFAAFNQWMWESNLANYYYVNVLFCVLFYANLFWYQIVYYVNADVAPLSAGGIFAFCTLLTLMMAFVFREITQLCTNFKSYWRNAENYLEVALLLCIGCTLLGVTWLPKLQIVGMCNVLMALSLTLLIGHTDFASTSVNILRTVSFTFFKYFLPYGLIFVAFARTFYLLFYSSTSTSAVDGNEQTAINETEYFMEILRVLAKFSGELEVSGISKDKYTFLPFVIVAGFILLCPIIMLNLLNGLAVCDIMNQLHLKIFMQKSRLDYLYNAQVYYKIPLFKKVLHCLGLKLSLENLNTIYICSDKPAAVNKPTNIKKGTENAQELPLLHSYNNSLNNILQTGFESVFKSDNSIFNNKVMKDAIDIINKLELSRSDNLQHTILSEISILNKILWQMNERFSKLDTELEVTRSKLNTRTDELLQKIKDLNTIIMNK